MKTHWRKFVRQTYRSLRRPRYRSKNAVRRWLAAKVFQRELWRPCRRSAALGVGIGLASTPRISMAPDSGDDKMYVKTSKGAVLTIDPPPRPGSGSSVIYWKQNQ